jgi:type II secretory pathway pseudopilin PulG
MNIILVVLGLMLAVATASADPYGMAINQAKRDSDQNNAEQRRLQNEENSGAQALPPAGNPPPAANPLLAATLQNISNLQTDMVAFIGTTADHPDPSQKIALLNDLSAAAQSTKASTDSVKELAKDLFTALAGNQKLLAQKLPLARQIHALFNSSHLTSSQQQTIYDNVQKILVNAGVSLGDAVDVVTDLKAIAAETK